MVIYGEYLFLENSLAGIIILMLTSKICGLHPSLKRIILGGGLCGIYSFIIFYEGLPWWLWPVVKVGFSLFLVTLVYSTKTIEYTLKTLLIFYIISLATGGIAIGSLFFFNDSGITAGGAFYIGHTTYMKIFSGMLMAWIGIYGFSVLLKERLQKSRTEAKLRVTLGNRTMLLNGFVDTGNFLKDPISGRPVCIATKKVIDELMPGGAQFCIVPYKSIDSDGGLLQGIRPDKAVLLAKGKKPYGVNIILALSKGALPINRSGEQYDVLLHQALTEGGIIEIG